MHSFLRNVEGVPYIVTCTMLFINYNPISRQTYSMIILLSIGVEIFYRNPNRYNRALLRYRINATTWNSRIL